jgi:hypothetical protein
MALAPPIERALALDRAQRGELLTPADMRAIFRMGTSQFAKLAKLGAFDLFKAKLAIGRARYSGVLVQQHLNGDEVSHDAFYSRRRRA